jgi:DNA-3-methyladenine glycosylase
MGERLGREFFARGTVDVARDLVGCELWTEIRDGPTSGRIVETEAYLDSTDLASHAARLTNERARSMRGPAGFVYVYRSYGIHPMFNIVCEPEERVGAVLIRALEPLGGLDLMRRRRGAKDDVQLCRGPGNLTIAMGITLSDHGLDVVTSAVIWLCERESKPQISAGPRVGISRSTELLFRFFETGSPFVSANRSVRKASRASIEPRTVDDHGAD